MPKKIYTLFRGVGGFDCGAEQAGMEGVGGVEYDAAIAADCDRNFPHAPTTVADIREVDPALLPIDPPDHVHASPSCKNASVANQAKNEDGTKETEFDRECGWATCRFIDHWRPPIFTLENVYAYRNFDAFGYILESLRNGGYSCEYWHLNAADYGIPQTRKRLILVAKKGNRRIVKPPATHHDPATRVEGQLSMFDDPTLPWVGWYEALKDLLPMLPDSKFADWQFKKLPRNLQVLLMLNNEEYRKMAKRLGVAPVGEHDRVDSLMDLMLWNMDQTARDVTIRYANEPVPTVDTGMMRRPSSIPQAILFANTGGNESYGKHHAEQDEPDGAITTQSMGRAKAFLVGKTADKFGDGLRWFVEPAQTIGANEHGSKAFVIDGKNSSNFGGGMTCLDGEDRIFTIQASHAKGLPRAYDGVGRVVSLTPQALACLQSFPDGFLFSDKKSLAATEIGNAVPPLLARRVVESIL